MKTLLCVMLMVSVGVGGEVLKDDQGRILTPVAKLNCAPLFEVKEARMTLCRVQNSQDYAILLTITYIHRASSTGQVLLSCEFKENAGDIFRESKVQAYCEKVKPSTLTQARLVTQVAKWSKACETIRFTPTITFSFTR